MDFFYNGDSVWHGFHAHHVKNQGQMRLANSFLNLSIDNTTHPWATSSRWPKSWDLPTWPLTGNLTEIYKFILLQSKSYCKPPKTQNSTQHKIVNIAPREIADFPQSVVRTAGIIWWCFGPIEWGYICGPKISSRTSRHAWCTNSYEILPRWICSHQINYKERKDVNDMTNRNRR